MNERSLFLEALEKVGPAQQSAYLDEACMGDAELRLRVEALLKSHDEAGSFLGRGSNVRVPIASGLTFTPETLGRERVQATLWPSEQLVKSSNSCDRREVAAAA